MIVAVMATNGNVLGHVALPRLIKQDTHVMTFLCLLRFNALIKFSSFETCYS